MRTKALSIIIFIFIVIGAAGCRESQNPTGAYLEQARTHFENGRYLQAAELVQKALSQNTKNGAENGAEDPEAVFLMGRIAAQQKKQSLAIQAYNRTITLDPGHREARLALAELLLANGQYDQARSHIEHVLKADALDEKALMLKSAQLLAQKQPQQAEAVLEDLKSAGKDGPEVYLLLASARSRQNDAAGAEKALQEGIDKHPGAAALYLARARLFSQTQRPEQAAQEMHRIMELEPDNLSYPLALAALYWDEKKTEQAEALLEEIIQKNQESVQARLLTADFYLKRQKAVKAEAVLRAALDALPDQMQLHLALSRFYSATRQETKAIETLLTYLGGEYKPAGEELQAVHLALAQAYFQRSQIDEAVHYTEMVLSQNPDHLDAVYLKGRIESARGRIDQAISAFKAVVSNRPDLEQGYLQLAQAYISDGKTLPAAGILQQGVEAFPASKSMHLALARAYLAHKDYKGAEGELLKVLKIDPADYQVQAELGDFYAQLKDLRQAEREYAEIVSKFPENHLGYIKLARLYQSRQDYAAAVAELTKGYRVCKEYTMLLTELVRTHLAAGDPQSAIDLCRQRLARNDKDAFSHNLLGQIYAQQKNFKEAGKSYEKAMELAPRWDEPGNNLAALYLQQNKKKEAVAHLENTLSKNSHNRAAYATLGRIYELDGEYAKAIDIYEKALLNLENSGDAAHRLAVLLCENGDGGPDLDRAYQLAIQAYQQHPGRVDIVETLGWIHYHKGEHEQALRLIEEVAKALPDNPLVNYHWGMVLLKTGKSGDARAKLETALKTDTPFMGRATAEKTLESLKTQG